MSDSSISFATLGDPIGYVTKLSGSAVVQSIDGQDRLIKLGDPIFFGETVVTRSDGSVTISFIDDTYVVIGPYSSVEMEKEIVGTGEAEESGESSVADIDTLQQAILEGADPTSIQDAPASGEALVEAQHRVDVSVLRNNADALPSYGYDTSGELSEDLETISLDESTGSTNSISINSISVNDVVVVNAPTITISGDTNNDNIYNAAELGTDGTVTAIISLPSSFDATTEALKINGVIYILSAAEIAAGVVTVEIDPEETITAQITDDAGNTSTEIIATALEADIIADAGTVVINSITADDVINLAESTSTITVTGTAIGGDISEDDVVILVINNVTYTTTVDSLGKWSVDVAGSDLTSDSVFDAIVSSGDVAGNTVSSIGTSTHTVDTKAFGQIDVYKITGDSVIGTSESAVGKTVDITGYVGNDARPGDAITVTLNGVQIGQGTVSTTQNSDGKYLYTVAVLGSDLAATTAVAPYITVTVTGEDEVGNAFSTESTEVYSVDSSGSVVVDLYVTDSDSIINVNEEKNVTVGGWLEEGGSVTSISITDKNGKVLTIANGFVLDSSGGWSSFEKSVDVSTLADGSLRVVLSIVDNYGVSGTSSAVVLTKDSDDVSYLNDIDSTDAKIAVINNTQGPLSGTANDDDLRGDEDNTVDTIDGYGGDDILIGNSGSDTLNGGSGDDVLIGGMLGSDDGYIDTLTGGMGDDIFILQDTGSLDVIADFNAQEDKLDLTALLTGLVDNPGTGADMLAIEEFLSANIKVTDQSVKVDGDEVATFGVDSYFDSDGSGVVNSSDYIKVIFNDQEYSINIDG
ncbi:retention module-containing protein [Marinomonas colpomeniae]|uniref:Retention module-containing protein n=1 Tax=Marinomonas colpomeniae TaxID=2774408 RepID=A0ABR8P1N9_9GAMM|nr:retention module-containing protein [Marinomonas colpomeniae]MBD5772196.1 retention module-containing protein [Marinomonas colpomeniae]